MCVFREGNRSAVNENAFEIRSSLHLLQSISDIPPFFSIFLWGKGAWEAMNNVSPSKIGERGKNVASISIGYVDATGFETGQENGISLKWELLGKTRVLVVQATPLVLYWTKKNQDKTDGVNEQDPKLHISLFSLLSPSPPPGPFSVWPKNTSHSSHIP